LKSDKLMAPDGLHILVARAIADCARLIERHKPHLYALSSRCTTT
jgi:hypothetical protein